MNPISGVIDALPGVVHLRHAARGREAPADRRGRRGLIGVPDAEVTGVPDCGA